MLAVQAALLKVALDNRVAPLRPSAFEMKINGGGIGEKRLEGGLGVAPPMWAPAPALGSARDELRRPWGFWRWKEESAYWRFVAGLACGLAAVHMLIRPGPGRAESYTMVLGALGLGIEALLPIPQLWQNYRGQSCKGFRLSVLINWLFGDTMKMVFFFMSEQGMIPWSFKACGVFQALCDLGLGVQYWMYGEGLDYDMNGHFA